MIFLRGYFGEGMRVNTVVISSLKKKTPDHNGRQGRGYEINCETSNIFLTVKIVGCCKALVAKAMANKWKWLGRALAVSDTIINNINTEHESQEERCYQVISHWEQTNESCKATVHHLMKAIEEVRMTEAMEMFDRHLAERHTEEKS